MPGALRLKVDGRWLTGGWGDCEWSHVTHGSDEMSWNMVTARNTRLRGRRQITLYSGNIPMWGGITQEPDWESGAFNAIGLWRLAENYPALNTSGVATSIVDDAIDGCIALGLPWTRPVSLSSTALVNDLLGEVPSLAELLDFYADSASKFWTVSPTGEVSAYTKPAATLHHSPTGESPVPTDDGFVTTLIGRYRTATGYATATVTDADAAARWGHKCGTIDMTRFGAHGSFRAGTILQGQLNKGRARMGWAHSLSLTSSQLRTNGGVPANVYAATAGKTLRIHVWDYTRELAGMPYLDVLIGRSTHRQDDPVVELEPFQMAATALPDVLASLKGA